MSEVEYNDDFPDEFDEQHEGVEETNPYLLMSSDDFRMHVVTMLNQAFENDTALHEAVMTTFKSMEDRLAESEKAVRDLRKDIFSSNH